LSLFTLETGGQAACLHGTHLDEYT